MPGTGEDGDLFGHSLSVGDVDGDGYADALVGAGAGSRSVSEDYVLGPAGGQVGDARDVSGGWWPLISQAAQNMRCSPWPGCAPRRRGLREDMSRRQIGSRRRAFALAYRRGARAALFALPLAGVLAATAAAPAVAVTATASGGGSSAGAYAGVLGPQGFQGFQDGAGSTGGAGPQGAVGPEGARGDANAPGPQGDAGPAGAQGVAGPQDAPGGAGASGVPGPQGVVGEAGPQDTGGGFYVKTLQGPFGGGGPGVDATLSCDGSGDTAVSGGFQAAAGVRLSRPVGAQAPDFRARGWQFGFDGPAAGGDAVWVVCARG